MAITMDGMFVNGQKVTFAPEDILSGDASVYTEEIGTAVEEWLEENVTGGEQVTDTTLTLPGVPADAEVTGNKIEDLKEDLNNVFTEPLTWVQGTINVTTGKTATDSDTTVVRTNAFYKFDKATGFIVSVPEGYTMRAYGYSTNDYTGYTGCSEYKKGMVASTMLPDESAFVRFVIRRADAGEITPVTAPSVELVKISFVANNAEDVHEIIRKTQGLFEETDNLWSLGNYLKDTGRVLGEFENEFPAGTYTLTMDVITNDVDSYRSKFELYKGTGKTYKDADRVVSGLAFNQNARTSVTFTANEPFTRFRIYASWTDAYSKNDIIIIKNIQLVSGDKPSEYKPPVIDNYNSAIGEIVTFTDFVSGYISTDHVTGDVINLTNVTADATASHVVIPCNEEDAFLIEAIGANNTDKRAVMFLDSNFAVIKKIWYRDDRTNDNYVAFDPHARIVYTPTSTKWIVVNHFTDEYTSYSPKVYKLSDNVLYNYLATYSYGLLPFTPVQDWKNHVVATYKSMVAIFKNGVVKLSKDCGYTWNSGVNISALGDISAFYLYANGTLAVFTNTKAYYIEDWTEYHEATCYETDGTLFTSTTTSNFLLTKSHTERKFVNGKDIFMFTNYHEGTIVRSLVWCSFDQGHTYKIIWEFGSRNTPTPTGSWQIRHGHDVIYYEPEDIFILCTGDSNATECMVFTVSLDVENQSCEVSLVGGPAREYKWSNMALWNNEIYYTQDNTLGSVWKCKYEDIGDLSKHEKILDGLYSDPTCLIIGNRGEMVVFCSESRNIGSYTGTFPFDAGTTARQIFYSSDRKTFVGAWLPVLALANKKSLLKHVKPVMSDGSLFALTYDTSGRVSFCLSDFLKSVGIVNAFAPVL